MGGCNARAVGEPSVAVLTAHKVGEMATAVASLSARFSALSVASVDGVWAWTAGAGEKSSAPATASSRSRAAGERSRRRVRDGLHSGPPARGVALHSGPPARGAARVTGLRRLLLGGKIGGGGGRMFVLEELERLPGLIKPASCKAEPTQQGRRT